MGRFLSPDPSGLLAQRPQDPQSWNLYAYALNNPLTKLDPNGWIACTRTTPETGLSRLITTAIPVSAAATVEPGHLVTWMRTGRFQQRHQMFQVGSVDGAGGSSTVDYTNFAAGAQTDANGNCLSGCGGYGFGSANADWLQDQLVGNSQLGGLDGYIQFLTGRVISPGWASDPGLGMQMRCGPLDYNDHWAGPGEWGCRAVGRLEGVGA